MSNPSPRALVRPSLGPRPVPRVPTPVRHTLANGLRVVAIAQPGLPQVAMRLAIPAGSAADPASFPGTASLVGTLLTEGTDLYAPEELAIRLDYLGASLGVQVGHDFAEIDMVLLSETLEPGLELFAEVVSRPSFPTREVERARAETLDLLAARLDEPANEADDRAALAVYGPDHPYGRITCGTSEGVAAVPRDAIVDFHRARYRPAGSVLIIAGRIDVESTLALLDRVFAEWVGKAPPVAYPAPPREPSMPGELIRLPWPDSAQGEIRVAGLGLPRSSDAWIPAAVANYLLGGSTITGRLGANLREDKGWTYGIRSGFAAAVQPGGWVIDTAVDVQVVDDALAEIAVELKRFLAEPAGEEELDRAKRAMILSLPRAFETPGRVVGRFATVESYGLEHDYWERFPARVEAVTAADVVDCARALFDPARLVRVVVGVPDAGAGTR